jgi:hypothetical protein
VTRPRHAELLLAAASVAFVLVLLLGAELLLRAIRPSFLSRTRVGHPHVYSERYGWALRPSASFQGRGGETITVNEDGYRGPTRRGSLASGRRRVALLGDSVTFGSGVADGETFSAQLERVGAVEALNLGVDGWGTDQELLRLRHDAGRLGATDVVLNVCVRNDHFDNALPVALYDGVSRKPYFTLQGDGLVLHDAHLRLTRAQYAAVALQERSYLFAAVLRLAGSGVVADGEDSGDWGVRREAVMRDFPAAARLTQRLVEEAARDSRAAGRGFLLVLHPDRRTFEGDDTLLAPLRELPAITTVDLSAEYRRRGLAWDAGAIDRIGHLSPRGHAVAAEEIGAALGKGPT